MTENKINVNEKQNDINEMDELFSLSAEDNFDFDLENDADELYSEHFDCNESANLSDAFKMYLHQISEYKLMTPDEEVDMFSKLGALPDGEERIALRNEIYTRNLRLVVSVSKKYFSVCQSMTPMDIVMEGNIGLLTAINRFDVTKGYKFSTYATWWIRQSVLRGIYNKDSLIRLPVHIQEKDFKTKRTIREYELEGKAIPSDFSDYLERDRLINPNSLDKPVVSENAHDDDSCLLDIIADEHTTEDLYFNIALREVINDMLNDYSAGKPCFSDREKEVITRHFGLNGYSPETLETIGETFGVSRERIRQIESKAIKRLRLPKNKTKLKEFYQL